MSTIVVSSNDQQLTVYVTPIAQTIPAGSIIAWAGTSASTPSGFLFCNGDAVSRTTYAALYAAIGDTWGAGNGTTTFNLPNGQGVGLRGVGSQTINGRSKSGPSLGSSEEDQAQGHTHYAFSDLVNASALNSARVPSFSRTSGTDAQNYTILGDSSGGLEKANIGPVGVPITDGTNGTPRTGTETRTNSIGINYIIKF